MTINKINVNGSNYDIVPSKVVDANGNTINIPAGASFTDTNTTYKLTINGTTNGDATNGISLGNITIPTSTAVTYSDVTYTVYKPSYSSSLSLNYNNGPVQVVTLTGNVSAITTSNIPAGHSLHVFLFSTSERTVAVAHNATARVCPEGSNLSLTVKANGYVEIDFFNDGTKTYVRGV
jgi:hypothetical protein